jgi:hypothetical protein
MKKKLSYLLLAKIDMEFFLIQQETQSLTKLLIGRGAKLKAYRINKKMQNP